MKNLGAGLVVIGFIVYFGGELVQITPYNLFGFLLLIVGAVLYGVGRKKLKSE